MAAPASPRAHCCVVVTMLFHTRLLPSANSPRQLRGPQPTHAPPARACLVRAAADVDAAASITATDGAPAPPAAVPDGYEKVPVAELPKPHPKAQKTLSKSMNKVCVFAVWPLAGPIGGTHAGQCATSHCDTATCASATNATQSGAYKAVIDTLNGVSFTVVCDDQELGWEVALVSGKSMQSADHTATQLPICCSSRHHMAPVGAVKAHRLVPHQHQPCVGWYARRVSAPRTCWYRRGGRRPCPRGTTAASTWLPAGTGCVVCSITPCGVEALNESFSPL
jgi:hypothetical protein